MLALSWLALPFSLVPSTALFVLALLAIILELALDSFDGFFQTEQVVLKTR
jgi:hypothetical protein